MARSNSIFRKQYVISIQIFVITLLLLARPVSALALVNPPEQPTTGTVLPEYKSFLESVQNGQAGVLRGVYVPGVFAMPIVQQPVGYPGFVSQNDGEVTQFRMATEVGNVGLLAHNYLSGASFTNLLPGQEVRLVYGDGQVEYFVIDKVLQYQALQPYSPNSEFRELDTSITITAQELFRQVYRGERHVTFQTCIEANGNSSWGRLFVTAKPISFPFADQKHIRNNLLPHIY